MSAAVVCGKRSWFEDDTFGSPSPFSSSKRFRCSSYVPAKTNLQSFEPMKMPNNPTEPENIHAATQKIEDLQDKSSTPKPINPMDGSSWVDIFVQEMMKASDVPDARGRAARILEAFEKTALANANSRASEKDHEIASLNENLQSMQRDDQILKRAIAIQHERSLEQEGKVKEVEQLKHAITQYQEQLKTLEMKNYALNLNLQRALNSNPMPSHFQPHVF